MARHRSITRLLITVTTMVLTLGGLSSTAHGDVAGVDRKVRVLGFDPGADFGAGFHFLGGPGFGTVTWDYTPVNGVVAVTARVQGTLYWDKVGVPFFTAGCARLRIFFQDRFRNNIQLPPPIQFCGPGNNANDPANQRAIDVSSLPDERLRHVLLVVGSDASGEMLDETGTESSAVSVSASSIINNGTADFGGRVCPLFCFSPHGGGTPLAGGSISLGLQNDGLIGGDVIGTLFWDSSTAGCARLNINFRDVNNVNLLTRTFDECAPAGGNAQSSSNQTTVNVSFDDARLFKIRLVVGTLVGGAFVGNVVSRTHSFGPNVGVAQGLPDRAFTTVGEDTTYGVQWTVPDPADWHSLDIIDVRLSDEEGTILQTRWDEAANTFSEFKPRTGRFSAPAQLGSHTRFRSSAVTMFLENSEVIGSGPTGLSVLLNLNLRFKQRAAGRTFTVEVLARDDSGGEQGWDFAGTITVLPRHGGDDEDNDVGAEHDSGNEDGSDDGESHGKGHGRGKSSRP